jgi:preprotein translocase subunit SecF
VSYNINFVKFRKASFTIAISITIIGILCLSIFKLNYGVDFKSGTTLDITYGVALEQTKAEEMIRTSISENNKFIITMGGGDERVTARFDNVLSQGEVDAVIAKFKSEFGEEVTYEENMVDVTLAKELAYKAIFSVIIASICIALYVVIRFEWRFAVASIISVLLDAFIVVSVFSIFRFEVNLPFVAAILTVIGYSINDRIVIFDRIRENLQTAKIKSFEGLIKLVNDSISQVLTRTVNTVLMVLFTAVAIMIFGSGSIRVFSFAISLGLVIGVFSSIFIACPIWLLLKNQSLNTRKPTSQIAKP